MTIDRIRAINRVLIANRGEIARRIMRTARDMGIGTAAVYADGDADAPFVREADVAIALDGESAAETYLNDDKVLDACRRVGADAVHPGYGFLSENSAFAKAVLEAGMIWVGPSPEAIARMGNKLSAKRLMREADVPTLAAVELVGGVDAAEAARDIGYPVLVKASAGGGGRGMRVVSAPETLTDSIDSARREAASAFGDDTLFLERWLPRARHVEVQILGDLHGNIVHCFERECSIQRRHQKIIEEAPSPAVDAPLRTRLGTAAVAAAKAIGYGSAGTVEFLLDGDEFWFLEVNARLQVEHPVTEEITGLDLVREQLRIAQGEPLGYGQDALRIEGHAIEARLYAEDPANDFLPSPGRVAVWSPSALTRARYDSGVETGSVVNVVFDPMIAKVIVHAPTRREAAARLARVLETTGVQGLITNRDFLVASLRTPEFIAGDIATDFIARVDPPRRRAIEAEEREDAMIAVAIEAQARRRAASRVLSTLRSGWRNSAMPAQRNSYAVDDQNDEVFYRVLRDGTFAFEICGDRAALRRVRVFEAGSGRVDLAVDGRRFTLSVVPDGETWLVSGSRGDLEVIERPRFSVPGMDQFTGALVAPMPGKVLAAEVSVGDSVIEGQLLLILEAMKMEHRITAPKPGTVSAVHVAAGDQVANGELLIMLDDAE